MNSNASSINNNIFFVRGYVAPQITRFTTPIITTIAQFPVQNQNDIMDLSMFKRPKKLFTPEKKTVLTTTFVFIAVIQDAELWTIKLRFNELISLYQFPLRRH